MTDQDHGGSHIKGLVMNIFDVLRPELLEADFNRWLLLLLKRKGKNTEEVFYTLQIIKYFENKSKSDKKIK